MVVVAVRDSYAKENCDEDYYSCFAASGRYVGHQLRRHALDQRAAERPTAPHLQGRPARRPDLQRNPETRAGPAANPEHEEPGESERRCRYTARARPHPRRAKHPERAHLPEAA